MGPSGSLDAASTRRICRTTYLDLPMLRPAACHRSTGRAPPGGPDADRLIIRYPSRWAALPCDDAPTTRPAQLPNGGACPAAKRACRLRSSAEGHTCAIPRIRPLRSDHRVHARLPEGGGPEELTGRDGMHEVVIRQRGERAQAEVSYPPIELDLIRECSEFRLSTAAWAAGGSGALGRISSPCRGTR
jgi:hypothetical protein